MKISFFFKSKQDPGISINHVMKAIVDEIAKNSTIEVSVYYIPSTGLSLKSIFSNLFFVYKHRTKQGVNHVVGEVHYLLYALIGCKSSITVHDIGFWTVDNYSKFKRLGLYFTHLFPISLADRIVAISNFTKNELLNSLPQVRKRIINIPSGSVDGFNYNPKVLDKSDVTILQNGVRPHKNLETTIRALQGLPYKLLVVRKMNNLQIQLAEKLHIRYENVYDLTSDQIKETYKKADIVCFPSSYEGFGVIPIEAQAIGRPVITTYKEPMISVAGNAALYINDPKNPEELRKAIMEIINDDDLRYKLIQRGLENVKQYSLDSISKKYIKMFQQISEMEAPVIPNI